MDLVMCYRELDMEDPKLKGWGMREGGNLRTFSLNPCRMND